MSLFCLVFVFGNLGNLFIQHTGIYTQTGQKNVLILQDSICIFDREEQRFSLYDSQGKFLRKFGRKGQGPGETELASYVMASETMIYVKDQKKINIFKSDGSFFGTAHIPEQVNGFLQRKMNGWLESSSPFSSGTNLWDEAFSNRTMLIPTELANTGSKSTNSSKAKFPANSGGFDPTRLVLFPILDQSGRFAYQPHPTRFEISIYDLEKNSKIHTVSKKITPVPLNKDWAQKSLDNLKAEVKKTGFNPDIKPNFPEVMPVIRWCLITPEGFLAVRLWGKNPWIDNGPLYIFGSNGAETSSVCYDSQSLQQVVGFVDENLLVLAYPNEEVALGKVKPEELKSFLAKYPVSVVKR